MIVPAMTLEDVRREISKDFPILHRKSSYVGQKLQRTLRDTIKKNPVSRFFEYQSKYKNNWIYKLYIDKKKVEMIFLTYYYGEKGLTALSPLGSSDMLLYLTGHFFNRYNERRKLNLVKPADMMRSFMEATSEYHFQNLTHVGPGMFEVFVVIEGGIALGTYYQEHRLYKLNTFIPSHMMRADQKTLEAQIKCSSIFKEELNELRERLPGPDELYADPPPFRLALLKEAC